MAYNSNRLNARGWQARRDETVRLSQLEQALRERPVATRTILVCGCCGGRVYRLDRGGNSFCCGERVLVSWDTDDEEYELVL